jgi:hypothetical protein
MFVVPLFTIAKGWKSAYMPKKCSMDKENVVYIQNGVLFRHKKEWNYAVFKKIDGTGHHSIE